MEKELLNIFDKELLLKDLCARLPHKLCVEDEYGDIVCLDYTNLHFENYFNAILEGNVKPYLFPLSSMTEEQREELKREYCNIACDNIKKMFANPDESHLYSSKSSSFEIDWFNKHHIDYRGLIEKGLAIDATDKNIY